MDQVGSKEIRLPDALTAKHQLCQSLQLRIFQFFYAGTRKCKWHQLHTDVYHW